MANKDDFIANRMSDDDAGLVAFQFVEYLKQGSGNGINKLIGEMRKGNSFERAFVATFEITPADMLKSQANPPR